MYILILHDKSQPIIGPFNSFNEAWNWGMKWCCKDICAVRELMPFTVKQLMSPEYAEENAIENSRGLPG